jgi:hypothetical protein
LKLSPDRREVEAQIALANAWVGDAGEADKLMNDLKNQFPLDTQVNAYWIPIIEARAQLAGNNPSGAIDRLGILQSPLEFGSIPNDALAACPYSGYTRGAAYLAMGQGSPAAA